MSNLSPEAQRLVDSLAKKEKLVALLAPSFPIDFDPATIAAELKSLGFTHIVEVSAGAVETNRQLLTLLKENPQARYITSPCPTLVRLIRKKYPQLVKFLSPTDSPMVATVKIVKEKYSGYRPVFIGPCLVKKLEASEDYPDLNLLVLTYKELIQVMESLGRKTGELKEVSGFDVIETTTRLYPISGGLAQSAKVKDYLAEDEYLVVSGLREVEAALAEFEVNIKIRLLDVLFCEGGCIGGPGIASKLSLTDRRDRITRFWQDGIQS
ncbi:MAG: [Fe-Fe] hydrogenase large subunit C-terminal domain-containing protein [Patescibacteria group bacterium]